MNVEFTCVVTSDSRYVGEELQCCMSGWMTARINFMYIFCYLFSCVYKPSALLDILGLYGCRRDHTCKLSLYLGCTKVSWQKMKTTKAEESQKISEKRKSKLTWKSNIRSRSPCSIDPLLNHLPESGCIRSCLAPTCWFDLHKVRAVQQPSSFACKSSTL